MRNHQNMGRFLATLLGAAFGAALLTTGGSAQAQEIQLTGPLAGAPAVRKLRLHREGRFELTPQVSFTFLDEYRRTIIPGATLQYNIKDWIGVGLWAGYGAVGLSTDLADQVNAKAPRNSRTAPNISRDFNEQTSRLTYFAAPQVQFSPFRGKLAIFQKLFADTDLYVHGGVAFVGVQERGDCGGAGQKSCTDATSFALQSRTAVAPTFGLGLSVYFSKMVGMRLEYRAVPFSTNRAGYDQRGFGTDGNFPDGTTGNFKVSSDDRTFSFNNIFTVGVTIALPEAKVSE